jgi:hypothetical protein
MSLSFPEVVRFLSYEIEFLLNYSIIWFQSTKFLYCPLESFIVDQDTWLHYWSKYIQMQCYKFYIFYDILYPELSLCWILVNIFFVLFWPPIFSDDILLSLYFSTTNISHVTNNTSRSLHNKLYILVSNYQSKLRFSSPRYRWP